MGNLRFAQSRSIIFKRQFRAVMVELEFPQTVGVGEFAEAVDLLGREWRLQSVADFEERHGGSIAALANVVAGQGRVWKGIGLGAA